MNKILFFFGTFLCFFQAFSAKLPVFVSDDVRYVTDPYLERISDITFGKHSFVLIDNVQRTVILIGVGSREVIDPGFPDAKYVAYGNGIFVIVGDRGTVAYSRDLYEWEISREAVDAPVYPGPNEGFINLIYHPDHAHFFAETMAGEIWVSQNGADWSQWGSTLAGDIIPSKEFPKISETEVIFEHEGIFLKFTRETSESTQWSIHESEDGKTWEQTGQIVSRNAPKKAYKRNTWVGLIESSCFLKVGENWIVENESYRDAMPSYFTEIAYSAGRSYGNVALLIRDRALHVKRGGIPLSHRFNHRCQSVEIHSRRRSVLFD